MASSLPPIVLCIAGFDPGSGAGITADVKTAAAHGCYALTALTGLTVQSTRGVSRVEAVLPGLLRDTLEELAADFQIRAVKIGMLASAGAVEVVAEFLTRHPIPHVVLDPVLASSSGHELLEHSGLPLLRDDLVSKVTVITPNLREAEILTGLPVTNLTEMRTAADRLHALGVPTVVLTGGHLAQPTDLLSVDGSKIEVHGSKIDSRSTHGTGCAFSTALACNLAHGIPIDGAVRDAKEYVRQAIERAVPLGKGNGPLNLLFSLDQKR